MLFGEEVALVPKWTIEAIRSIGATTFETKLNITRFSVVFGASFNQAPQPFKLF
jgi:hypothetical protein